MTIESPTLDALVKGHEHIRLSIDSDSPWITVLVGGRVGFVSFGVWKATDALYTVDRHGAAADDPISVEEGRALIEAA